MGHFPLFLECPHGQALNFVGPAVKFTDLFFCNLLLLSVVIYDSFVGLFTEKASLSPNLPLQFRARISPSKRRTFTNRYITLSTFLIKSTNCLSSSISTSLLILSIMVGFHNCFEVLSYIYSSPAPCISYLLAAILNCRRLNLYLKNVVSDASVSQSSVPHSTFHVLRLLGIFLKFFKVCLSHITLPPLICIWFRSSYYS